MASEGFARRVVELSQDLICLCRLDGQIEEVNPRWQELLGWTPEELRSHPWQVFVHPEDVESTRRAAERALAGKPVTDFENRLLARDGTTVHVLWSTVLASDVGCVIGMGRDVSRRRQRDAQLDATRRLLAEGEHVARVGSWQWSANEPEIAFSPELRRMFGLGPDDPVSLEPRDPAHPEDVDRLHDALRATLDSGCPLDLRLRVRCGHEDDRELVLHYRAEAELGPDGDVVRVHGTVQDVTDQATVTRRLRRMTRAALEISSAATVAAALEQTERAVRDLTGARQAGAVLLNRGPDITGPERAVVERQQTVCTGSWVGAPLVAKDGGTMGLVHVSDHERQFTSHHEQVLAHVAHIAAVSLERLDLEDRFLQAQRVEAVGRLAAGIIHDFNNTLAVVLVRSELLQASVSDPEVAAHAAELHAAARAAADVASDLLALSRTSHEARPTPPRETTDVADVARDVVRLAAPLLGRGVQLDLRLGDDALPTLLGRTDLHQVLMNLVLNARDAIRGVGTITITAGIADDHVAVDVRDDGTGMTAETRSEIFTPYFTTKAGRGGTGLGLASVQTIISRAGGRIEVDSEPGRGSTFTLHIPLAGGATAVVPSPAGRALPGGAEAVAVLGRNRSVVAVIEALLDSLGYAVAPSKPGREAGIHGAALVVLEGQDPAAPPPAAVPRDAAILRLTGPGAAAPGDPHVLQRPVTADQLARTVREILDERAARLRSDADRAARTGDRRFPADVHPSGLDG